MQQPLRPQFVFLRGLWDNDISLLNNIYLFLHAFLFSRKDFRWPNGISTVFLVPLLTPDSRKYRVFSTAFVYEILLSLLSVSSGTRV